MENPRDFYTRGKSIGKWQGRLEAVICIASSIGMLGLYVTYTDYRDGRSLYAISIPSESTVFIADAEATKQHQAETLDSFPMAYEAKKGK